jgi:nucleotide-binding universal stress UspA family protein
MSAPLVVGYDGTEHARVVLAEALRLAAPLGAEVIAVYAVRVNPLGGEVKDFAAALEEEARMVLAEATLVAEDRAIRTVVARGRVRDALAEVARREDAQMIVVGATPWRLLGAAPVPVLVVPA